MNKLLVIGIVFLLIFVFPIMMNEAHAAGSFTLYVSSDKAETVYVDGTLITAHYGASQALTVGWTIQVSISAPSLLVGLDGGGGQQIVVMFYFYIDNAGTVTMNLSDIADVGYSPLNLIIIKGGDYLYNNEYHYSGGSVPVGLVNVSIPANFMGLTQMQGDISLEDQLVMSGMALLLGIILIVVH